jgi:hypothetical protein
MRKGESLTAPIPAWDSARMKKILISAIYIDVSAAGMICCRYRAPMDTPI